MHAIKAQDLAALSPAELAQVATRMLEQAKRIDSQVQAIKWRDAKIESITMSRCSAFMRSVLAPNFQALRRASWNEHAALCKPSG